MAEKSDWELVDVNDGPGGQKGYEPPPPPPTLPQVLRALLGKWWAWKLAGLAIVFSAVLVLLATVAGVLVVLAAGAALVSAAVARFRKWRRDIYPPPR